MCSEAILCIKNGKELFQRTIAHNIILWLLIQLVLAFAFVYGCILWHKYVEVILNINFMLKYRENIKIILFL